MDFLNFIKSQIVLFDGAMGTMLLQAGLSGGECPEMWNKTHPDVVYNIHNEYYKAGCNVVETNSFGGNSIKLAHYNLSDIAAELNKLAAEQAKKAVGENGIVAGSVGPCGKFLKPLGDLEEKTLYESFKEQITGLADGGADIICIETMMDINEALIAIRAAKENTDLPIVATMTFNKTPKGFFTMMGIKPDQAAQDLVNNGADVVGANCGNGPVEMLEMIPLFKSATDIPLLFQSNAGMPKLVDGETLYQMGPDEYANYLPKFIDAGARLIGGCCGTSPEHMAKVKAMLDELQ